MHVVVNTDTTLTQYCMVCRESSGVWCVGSPVVCGVSGVQWCVVCRESSDVWCVGSPVVCGVLGVQWCVV